MREKILVSWVAYNRDPFERERSGEYRLINGQHVNGPSLEILTNSESPYRSINRAIFLVRDAPAEKTARQRHVRELEVFEALREELQRRRPQLDIRLMKWQTRESPIAYAPIFQFTAKSLRAIRSEYPTATLVVHLSPGTPQMQTMMLLALQARFAGEHVEAVQGIPEDKRRVQSQIVESVPWDLLGTLNAKESVRSGIEPDTVWSIDGAASARYQTVAEQIRQFGRLSYPVLIIGPRGCGKTHVAERLRARFLEYHGRGSKTERWDFRVNCASLSGDMLKSELFGHAKGAFTGAVTDRKGLLEQAEGDCVFLDEIHHLSLDAQAELLLALEHNGELHRVGDTRRRKADFRLVAATNLSESALQKRLLPDFYDRIADFIIEMPALRECPDDIAAIWDLTLRNTCAEVARSLGRIPGLAASLTESFADEGAQPTQQLRTMRLDGNWRDLQRLARRILARSLTDTGQPDRDSLRSTIDAELCQLCRNEAAVHAQGEAIPLLDALPDAEACLEVMRHAYATGVNVPYERLTRIFETRLVEAAVTAAGSERAAGRLLEIPQKTLNNKRKRQGQSYGATDRDE